MTVASSSTKPYSKSDKKRKSTPTNIWLLLGLVWLVAFLGAGCAYVDNPVNDLSMGPSSSLEDTPTISQPTQVHLGVGRSKTVSTSSEDISPPSGTLAPLSGSSAWEDDRFDDLLTWPLHGQNGWIATRSSPHVIPDDHGGKFLEIDARSQKSISIGKDVPDQRDGYHLFEFEVMVNDATSPSLAKIEVQTLRRSGWNKKFQIYFGSSFRVSSSLRTPATTIVEHTQMGHRYHVRCEINLDANLLDVWVDKSLVVSELEIHPGPIVGLSISGWDLPGAVFLDNLLGSAMAPPLSVEITSPPQGATVTGLTPIRASASKDVEWVDFYIDGVLQHSDTSRPFEYGWETAINPLPYPNHPIDFGYYFVEWKNPKDFDAARAEVNEYTNLYYASRSTYDSDLSAPEWSALLSQSLANAQVEGKRIHLALEDEGLWDDVLDVATPYWDYISRIEIEDEPHLSRTQTEAMIQRLKSKLATRALPHRPMGFVYAYNEALPDAIHAPGLDWVGIEAYLDYPGSPDSQANVEVLNKYLSSAKAQVPDGKQIVLVMMAYDRNGDWTNMDTLRDLQFPVYMQAFDDPRVVAITMFSYTRQGGSRDHPGLWTPHRLIGERILGVYFPDAGNGLRTLTVHAFNSHGVRATDRVTVNVQESASPTLTPTPILPPSRDGLIVRGFVNETPSVTFGGGPGLLGAKIYLQLGSNLGQVIATTDQDGYFESDFIPILGDEKVRVWAEKRGYRITPDQYSWDHLAGYEERELYFRAEKLASPTPIPTRPSEPGLTIRGYVTRRPDVTLGGGPGLHGVKIYLQLGFGTARMVAITDQDGNYQSDFIYIPGTETIRVWAEKDGYLFTPDIQSWLHYPGYEERELYFEAQPLDDPTPTPTPTGSSMSIFRIYGCVTQPPSVIFGGGSGVAGVAIYLQLSYGNSELVAVTNLDGRYQSGFISVPMGEMVSVWAVKEGFTFSPEQYNWRQSALSGEYALNFEVQSITTPTPTPWLTPTPTLWLTPTPTTWQTPTPTGSPVPPPVPDLWENDSFDLLTTGSLHGQNGWVKGQASAWVIPIDDGGKILEINPDPDATINMSKYVPRQDTGTHRFEFDVMVTGATEPSLAKIEIRTHTNAGWDKKFQLYFGSSMRVNYNPSGAAVNFISTTQMGRWYHIRCDMNLDGGKVNIWVDGANVVSGIPMHPGPIVGLSISGWDRAGAVYLDNLLGSR